MNKLEWYYNRLSLMSPTEIGFRVFDEVKKKCEKVFTRDFEPNIELEAKKVSWLWDEGDKMKLREIIKKNNLWDESKTLELMEHKFSFFCLNKKFIGEGINWHKDYKNEIVAPVTYSKHLDYRDFLKVGDYKYIWEINRHQHLISLAKAYYVTGKQEYRDEVVKQIKSWIEQNPYMKGTNWSSTLELGVRLISWSWVWFFLGDLEKDFKEIWLKSIYKHCHFISDNISYFPSSKNNHLIGEAAGLFIGSVVWPFLEGSEHWQRKSQKMLLEEIQKQNFNDGVNKEQAISYQQFVLDFFMQAGLIGEKNGLEFPKVYWCRIEQMLNYIASMMDFNGNIPKIGDADDGFSVILSDSNKFDPYKSLLASGAILFNRGDFKSKSGGFDEKSLWLLGMNGLEKFNALEKKYFKPKNCFENGGYFILGNNDNTEKEIKGIFDCGPLGYLSLAAHGHADALNFLLNIEGKEFLIDPGTYIYQGPQEWRDYFKGTSAHNTIRIDKENQSVIGGNFMWLRKAKSKVLEWETNDKYDLIKGEHDGYIRLKDPVIHKREVYFDKESKIFRIIDEIDAKDRHLIEQFFHFSEKCVAEQINKSEWRIATCGSEIILKMDPQFQTLFVIGGEQPILGWKSEKFDCKEKSPSFQNSFETQGPCKFETLITMDAVG